MIALGVWWALSEIDFELKATNIETGEGQYANGALQRLCFTLGGLEASGYGSSD